MAPVTETVLTAPDYDLGATLSSGQAFRWRERDGAWEGVLGAQWVRLRQVEGAITATTAPAVERWDWLTDFLQLHVNLRQILATFPDDEPMRSAVAACRGLRLLRQEPWECLASFILSSTKQIVQIQQIVALLCARYGQAITAPDDRGQVHAFPRPERLAALSAAQLRECKMGFRAPYLQGTARMLADGEVDLNAIAARSLPEARAELLRLPGVGPKIADCVLLFAFGFPEAFPVDVWIRKALQQFYFPRRRVTQPRLERFKESHFGPHAGYAQQYLFHYARTLKAW